MDEGVSQGVHADTLTLDDLLLAAKRARIITSCDSGPDGIRICMADGVFSLSEKAAVRWLQTALDVCASGTTCYLTQSGRHPCGYCKPKTT